jgi:predicted component of type VI protein secretion system
VRSFELSQQPPNVLQNILALETHEWGLAPRVNIDTKEEEAHPSFFNTFHHRLNAIYLLINVHKRLSAGVRPSGTHVPWSPIE